MSPRASSIATSSSTAQASSKPSSSSKSPISPKWGLRSSFSDSPVLTSPQVLLPRSPPPRPPRPKTSLPNLRPTVILSPLAIPPPCAYRLPTPIHCSRSDRFSDDVFGSLPEHLRTSLISLRGGEAQGSPCNAVPIPSGNHSSLPLSPNAATKGGQDFGDVLHAPLVPPEGQDQNRPTTNSSTLSIGKCCAFMPHKVRAMDSFERAIHLCRHPETRVSVEPVMTYLPIANTASPRDSPSSFSTPSKLESSTADAGQRHLEICHVSQHDARLQWDDQPLPKSWHVFVFRHRRLLRMVCTVLFVILASTAIAGGVIWKLTTLDQVDRVQ
ncbi:hypothetical protein CLAIMM_10819 isoform 1 [Cladophialophora immunda]|nr:hypothetical protein CLAIMM_10819 isoform 1 [Cladophialophora immunda]